MTRPATLAPGARSQAPGERAILDQCSLKVTDAAATHRYMLKHRETVSERWCEADRRKESNSSHLSSRTQVCDRQIDALRYALAVSQATAQRPPHPGVTLTDDDPLLWRDTSLTPLWQFFDTSLTLLWQPGHFLDTSLGRTATTSTTAWSSLSITASSCRRRREAGATAATAAEEATPRRQPQLPQPSAGRCSRLGRQCGGPVVPDAVVQAADAAQVGHAA